MFYLMDIKKKIKFYFAALVEKKRVVVGWYDSEWGSK